MQGITIVLLFTILANTRYHTPTMTVSVTPVLSPKNESLLAHVKELKQAIDTQKQHHPELWEMIQKKLRIQWTYDSNAIEGSTLTLGETLFFLQEGLTVEGKPFKDFLDAQNHAQAIELLFGIIHSQRPLTEGLIKEINALLLSGVTHTPALGQDGQKVTKPATPGQYKHLPNHVLQSDGSIHRYTDPLHVTDEMESLVSWVNTHSADPVIIGAIFHYHLVRIHPFDDGNGRVARLLMNLVLIKAGYPPAIIQHSRRRAYLESLARADAGELEVFIGFVLESLETTMVGILGELN